MANTIITFGKHNGKSINDIAKSDMNWLIWFSKNYDPYYFVPRNRYQTLKKSTIDSRLAILREAKAMVEEHFKSIEENNRQQSNSEFIGTLRKRMIVNATVDKISYEKIILSMDNGSKILIYDKDFNLQIGDKIQITGTPSRHYESMGIKYTYFNRVKINK